MKTSCPETADSTINGLYRIGGASALLCAVMYLVAMAIYIPANFNTPPPGTVLGWFTLFQVHPLAALFFLGLADIVIMILWCPLSLALYTALKRSHQAWSMIATALVLVGIAVFLATNAAFSMLALSRQHAAAPTEAQPTLLAAGQAVLAAGEGRYAGMPLAWLGGLVLSAVMLRSVTFRKATAWVGMLGLGLLAASAPFAGYTPSTGPATVLTTMIIAVTYTGGGLLSLAWYILVGLRLWGLGRPEGRTLLR
jgi:hypothetical protein